MTNPIEPIIIHSIEGTRAFRVVWLCEELNLPYKLMFKPGDFMATSTMLHTANPLMPMYPTVFYDGMMLVESGAIMEFLVSRHGMGRLEPPRGSDDYITYLQWMHFAEGTIYTGMWAARYAAMVAGISVHDVPHGDATEENEYGVVGIKPALNFVDDFLSKNKYFAGDSFSAADIMMYFSLRASNLTAGIDSRVGHPSIAAWRI